MSIIEIFPQGSIPHEKVGGFISWGENLGPGWDALVPFPGNNPGSKHLCPEWAETALERADRTWNKLYRTKDDLAKLLRHLLPVDLEKPQYNIKIQISKIKIYELSNF